MAEYLSPGVYVIEESSGIKPIEGVGTSTAAFVGITEKGPVDKPTLITSFSEYVRVFGAFNSVGILPFSVYQFFQEGGKRCYIMRTVHHDEDGDITLKTATASADSFFKLEANYAGSWPNRLKDNADQEIPGSGLEADLYEATSKRSGFYKIDVYYGLDLNKPASESDKRKLVESFDELTNDTVKDIVNKASNYIVVAESSVQPTNIKEKKDAVKLIFSGGDDGVYTFDLDGKKISTLTKPDFIGNPTASKRYGLLGFDVIDEINNVAIPDAFNVSPVFDDDGKILESKDQVFGQIMKEGMVYCEGRGDCFFIADVICGVDPQLAVKFKEDAGLNSTYGALYYPWLKMNHPQTGGSLDVPCSGAVSGIFARTDVQVGVHKAPAGHATGKVNSANGVHRVVTSGEQDLLNPNGINVIRPFPNIGILVWGARTVSTDAEWRYINVRRLFLYVKESIDEGTQWVVFEPNSSSLWGTVKRNLTIFLTTVWRSGALFGETPEEAFYVKVDEENNPPEERDAGRLNIEVGIAPVKPAEFVIIRISQKTLLEE